MLVFFACEADTRYPTALYAFARPVNSSAGLRARLRAAVRSYFDGPSESEPGFYGFGSPNWLNGVDVRGKTAVIDLDLRGGYGGTSAQSALVWASLQALAFQFPQIELLEPRYNGDCGAFGAVVQAEGCLLAKRDGTYVSPQDLPD